MSAGARSAAQTGNAPSAPISNVLKPYTSCDFPDMLRIVSLSPITPGPLLVATAAGTQNIDLEAGEQVMFAYPLTDFFANAKVELLSADQYEQSRKILLANMALMESQRNGPVRAEALPAGLHGFDVHGNDRMKLDGDVLGMYLLFDDAKHVVTTVTFLNQHSWERKFQTMDEYGQLRDRFLRTYTGCIRQNQAIDR